VHHHQGKLPDQDPAPVSVIPQPSSDKQVASRQHVGQFKRWDCAGYWIFRLHIAFKVGDDTSCNVLEGAFCLWLVLPWLEFCRPAQA